MKGPPGRIAPNAVPISNPFRPEFGPSAPRDFLVRQNFRDEGAEQAAGQHARQDFAEQPEIMREDLEHAIDAVAPPDQRCADRDQRADRRSSTSPPACGARCAASARASSAGAGSLSEVLTRAMRFGG